MSSYEFKVVPAPRTRFGLALFFKDPGAMTLAQAVNALADDGWTFFRTDRLPVQSRTRLFFGLRTPRDVLVFRRARTRQVSRALGPERSRSENAAAFSRDAEELLSDLVPLGARRAA